MRFSVLLQCEQNGFCGLCYTHFPLFLHVGCSEVSVCVRSLPTKKKKGFQRMKQGREGAVSTSGWPAELSALFLRTITKIFNIELLQLTLGEK